MNISVIQVTKDCNQDCIYCCRDREVKNLDYDGFRKVVDEISSDVDQIIITGGEPTLLKELPSMIKYASKTKRKIHLQTNGINFEDEEYCHKIIQSGVSSILLAIPSLDPKNHSILTERKNLVEKKKKALRNLAPYKDIDIGIVFVPNILNYKEISDYIDLISSISRDIYLQITYPVDYEEVSTKHSEFMIEYDKFYPELEKAIKKSKEFNVQLRIDGIPLCQIPDVKISLNQVSDLKSRRYQFSEDFIDIEKKAYDSENYSGKKHLKTKDCKECLMNDECKGVYTHYVKVHGLDFIKPLK